MDMLEVGNGLTNAEERAHFSLWAMMDSPLILGNDLRNMNDSTRLTLTNKDIIALNQDTLGIQAIRYMGGTKVEVYIKPLVNAEWAVLFLNRSEAPVTYEFHWKMQYFEDDVNKLKADFGKADYGWRNLWTGMTGTTAKGFRQTIPAHDVVVLRLKRLS